MAVTFNDSDPAQYVIKYVWTSYTSLTYPAAFDAFNDDFAVWDSIAWNWRATWITFTVDVPLAWTDVTGVWEFSNWTYTSFAPLTGVVDPSNWFTVAWTHHVTFDRPKYIWGGRTWNRFWWFVRYRITGVTTPTSKATISNTQYNNNAIRITGTGESIKNAYDTDVLNWRWIITRLDRWYLINSNLYIWDWAITTDVADTFKDIQVWTEDFQVKFQVNKYATYRLWELLAGEEYGGNWWAFRYYNFGWYQWYDFGAGNYLMYWVVQYIRTWYWFMINWYSDFRDCSMWWPWRTWFYNATQSNLIRCNVIDASWCMIYTSKMTISDVVIEWATYWFVLWFGLTGVVRDTKITRPTTHFYMTNWNSQYNTFDTIFDYYKVKFYVSVYSHKGIRDYKSLQTLIKDSNWTPIENATITLTNTMWTETTFATDSEWEIGKQDMLVAHLTPNWTTTYVTDDMIVRYAPYNIKIEKEWYITYEDVLAMDNKTSLEIWLIKSKRYVLDTDWDFNIMVTPSKWINSLILKDD